MELISICGIAGVCGRGVDERFMGDGGGSMGFVDDNDASDGAGDDGRISIFDAC